MFKWYVLGAVGLWQPELKGLVLPLLLARQFIFFHPFFCQHFWLEVSDYGKKILGFPDNIVAFCLDAMTDELLTGADGLHDNNGAMLESLVEDTSLLLGDYPLARFFDERLALVLDSHTRTNPTFEWNERDKEKLNHTIATFPIKKAYSSRYTCNNVGIPSIKTNYTVQQLVGDIVWRSAVDKTKEKYMINDSTFFHNLRYDVSILRREWNDLLKQFVVSAPQTLAFDKGQSWTAKLRFISEE